MNAAMHRAAVNMIGQPFLGWLLDWCEGDDVADAIEGGGISPSHSHTLSTHSSSTLYLNPSS